ncbi:MAG: hypothetical protein L0287_14610 [Anaerolineae bacterium]|nr:hypothetical protein [Anaerolineae bacterium]
MDDAKAHEHERKKHAKEKRFKRMIKNRDMVAPGICTVSFMGAILGGTIGSTIGYIEMGALVGMMVGTIGGSFYIMQQIENLPK